ncbi:MAG: hypothetical protein ACLPPV_02180 [Candidatus Korobacteraceae bacterium]
MSAMAENPLSRRLEDVRSRIEDELFGLEDVAGVSVKTSEVVVYLVRDSSALRQNIDKIVHTAHPSAHLDFEVSGEFRAL